MSETTILMLYTAYVEVKVPNEIADKMRDGEIDYRDRWGSLFYTDGKEVEIPGIIATVDYKKADSIIIEDNTKERQLLAWQNKLKSEKKSKTPVEKEDAL